MEMAQPKAMASAVCLFTRVTGALLAPTDGIIHTKVGPP